MKLLLDHNLSPRLVERIAGAFPGADHVARAGLAMADDATVWSYAKEHGFTIVTKDSDFSDLSVLRGVPPKVVWLRIGNCTTEEALQILLARRAAIEAFLQDPASGLLVLA